MVAMIHTFIATGVNWTDSLWSQAATLHCTAVTQLHLASQIICQEWHDGTHPETKTEMRNYCQSTDPPWRSSARWGKPWRWPAPGRRWGCCCRCRTAGTAARWSSAQGHIMVMMIIMMMIAMIVYTPGPQGRIVWGSCRGGRTPAPGWCCRRSQRGSKPAAR